MDLVINFNKPSGITSQQAVSRIKRLLGIKKAGHTGTLDPLATGVMLVCIGEATKVAGYLLNMDKTYHARVKLGERTDTFDAEGRITDTAEVPMLSENNIAAAAGSFLGCITQMPPMYSAIKVDGVPLYKLARKGLEIERQARRVEITDIQVSGIALPFFDLKVSCSKGTYIRSLCDDLGQRLGSWAHLVSLERVAVGSFNISDSVTSEGLASREIVPDGRAILSIDEALAGMPALHLSEEECRRIRLGQRIPAGDRSPDQGYETAKLKGPDGQLIALGGIDSGMIVVRRNLKLELDFLNC